MTATDVLRRLPDGTVKQRNPFTGTQVWTMPGRAKRPLPKALDEPVELPPGGDATNGCAFCPGHHLSNPPEKARLVREDAGWRTLTGLPARELDASEAQFRRVPNLFEICSMDYWLTNHGVEVPAEARARAEAYLADPMGREHLARVLTLKLGPGERDDEELLQAALNWCSSTHELVIPRRHHVEGATMSDDLASSGALTADEHRAYVAMTLQALADLYRVSDGVRYVAVFQNWLRPAGASFEHLHKQVVAIDEFGGNVEGAAAAVEQDPEVFNRLGLDVALANGLVLAENDRAVAWAGFGHRYPTIEIVSLSEHRDLWRMDATDVDAMSDLLHAVHAAGGPTLSCNEEWHHRPPALDAPLPWRILVKWRISTLAGFEGDTKINLNTLSPWDVRDRVLARLSELREQGRLAAGVRIGDECRVQPGAIPSLS